jgi:hypothetical protein
MDSYQCYWIRLWDGTSAYICDTITWFPTKTVRPLVSTAGLVLTGITDIQQSLLLKDSYQCCHIWFSDGRAVYICDTITWTPTKIVISLASTTDLVLADITDI